MLGCQLEQSLLAEKCGRVSDSVGEAQHGQAAEHFGIFSALLAILCWAAATPPNQVADTIQIKNQDIHLAEIIIRVNLLLKKELRREEHQLEKFERGAPAFQRNSL